VKTSSSTKGKITPFASPTQTPPEKPHSLMGV
jgi:hypothetical protein